MKKSTKAGGGLGVPRVGGGYFSTATGRRVARFWCPNDQSIPGLDAVQHHVVVAHDRPQPDRPLAATVPLP